MTDSDDITTNSIGKTSNKIQIIATFITAVGVILSAYVIFSQSNTESTDPLSATSEKIKEPDTVIITGGSFNMGSESSRKNELGVHDVEIETFRLGKFEVTFEEFDQFVRQTK